uniref:C-type lectin domain-containing protein n=1 Tax=Panagrolaimus sp. JU765 TaxID=591449 RepID=A0AC34QBM7_9BILA
MKTAKLNGGSASAVWGWTKDNELMTFSDWDPTETQSGNCTMVKTNSLWSAVDCETKNRFVCQIPAQFSYCDDGWTYYKQTNSCYKRFMDRDGISHPAAENNCVDQGGHLASIHSSEENSFVGDLTAIAYKTYYMASVAWIGGKRETNDGPWYWTDGTTFDYTNWGRDYDYTDLYYMLLYPDYTDTYDNQINAWEGSVQCCAYHYVCQKSPSLLSLD